MYKVPDNYCDPISLNQTVKATGNGWDVGMVTHIFNQLTELNMAVAEKRKDFRKTS